MIVPTPRAALVLLLSAADVCAQVAPARPAVASANSFAAKTKPLVHRAELLATYLDPKAGRVFLELPRPAGPCAECGRYLYLEGIQTGLGSNPVGLDRGQSLRCLRQPATGVVAGARRGARVCGAGAGAR